MLRQELDGEPYVKSKYRREALEGPLSNRSKGAFEFRMQNFSAFFDARGMPYVQGYKPRGHIGAQVEDKFQRIFDEMLPENVRIFEHTSDESELLLRARAISAHGQRKAPSGNAKPEIVQGTARRFKRSPAIVAYVLTESRDLCECCGRDAPFKGADGTAFLEVHHLKPLADGGPDTTDNAAACCPNCHREMHFGENGPAMTAETIKRVTRLKEY